MTCWAKMKRNLDLELAIELVIATYVCSHAWMNNLEAETLWHNSSKYANCTRHFSHAHARSRSRSLVSQARPTSCGSGSGLVAVDVRSEGVQEIALKLARYEELFSWCSISIATHTEKDEGYQTNHAETTAIEVLILWLHVGNNTSPVKPDSSRVWYQSQEWDKSQLVMGIFRMAPLPGCWVLNLLTVCNEGQI